MPINARVEYFVAEKKYREAKGVKEKIAALEEMLKYAPTHKGAENLRKEIRQKLAKYRELLEKEKRIAQKKGKSMSVKKEGAAQVVIISLPNAGKSTLLAKLTNAKPEIAPYEFTTTKPEIGVMDYFGVKIQIVEIPAFYDGFAHKGNGPSYFGVIRNADLVIILLDLTKDTDEQISLIKKEFEEAKIKLNKKKPNIKIEKTEAKGIRIIGGELFEGKIEELKALLKSKKLFNVSVRFFEKAKIEDIEELLQDGVAYLKGIMVFNKLDISKKKISGLCISALTGENLETLKTEIWKKLGLIKVFTKSPGKPKEFPPVALKKGSTIRDLALNIHKEFVKKFKFARVWGKSVKFGGAHCGLDHKLCDDDVVEIHLK